MEAANQNVEFITVFEIFVRLFCFVFFCFVFIFSMPSKVIMAVFIVEDTLSVRMNLGKHSSFDGRKTHLSRRTILCCAT